MKKKVVKKTAMFASATIIASSVKGLNYPSPIFPRYDEDFEKRIVHPFYKSTDVYEIQLCD